MKTYYQIMKPKNSLQLIDRFGPLPSEVEDLIQSFKLRWLAQSLGLEKLVLKQNKMIGHFISNPQSKFYETETFTAVLNYIQHATKGCKISEANDRLRIIYDDVKDINKAYEKLNEINNQL